jgi:hypothetical protein
MISVQMSPGSDASDPLNTYIKTTPLLTVEDGIAAMQKAAGAGYRPPGG